ncbi:MAG TPA: hypothetical protein VIM29_07980 [Bacillota bacterium]
MGWKALFWVGSIATFFFFLPSLLVILWDNILSISWRYQRWLVYVFLVWLVIILARRRWRRLAGVVPGDRDSLLLIAKRRLVQGELTLEEFRQIRDELKAE